MQNVVLMATEGTRKINSLIVLNNDAHCLLKLTTLKQSVQERGQVTMHSKLPQAFYPGNTA